MANSQSHISSVDLECGHRSSAGGGGANEEVGEIGDNEMHLWKVGRDCRICHLSLVSASPETGVAIELGCSCKDDLAAVHRHCAETWFKIKGNKTCEICNSIARNVVGPNEIEAAQQTNGYNSTVANSVPAARLAKPCLEEFLPAAGTASPASNPEFTI
ncbi:unnamed protein product [Fraxinus pennsylvanica]|uniref:RING-CH-type domain-containing protein n=1 Tax=Fraxinus pennsylvanica TaxID=56036 RepID=A0AAD2A0C1_9LAMI|nr:unnamed protein product [Fraxinus pennsylvanica]